MILAFLLVISIEHLTGQDGTLDFGFGEDGVKKISLSDRNTRGQKLLYLDDGSIIIGINSDISNGGSLQEQSFYIYKLQPNGELDSTFGQNGNLYFPNGDNGKSYIHSLLNQSIEKFIVFCEIDGGFKLLKCNLNGTIDQSVDISDITNSYCKGNKIDIQFNGKIVVAAQYYDGYSNFYKFSRYNNDGSIDSSFGINGSIQPDITPYRFDLCQSIKVDSDNKIIAVGASFDEATQKNAVIVRFNENGSLDNSFGENGVVITDFNSLSSHGEFMDVDILPTGEIIVGGNMEYSGGTGGFGGSKPAIAKFNSNGTLNYSFGNQGIVIMNTIFDANDSFMTLIVQPDHKIIYGGGASLPFPYMQTDFYISRLNSDGSVDTEFGNNGSFLTSFANAETNKVHDLCLDNKGKILAIGITKDSTNQFFNAVICRLNNESLIIENHQNEPEINIFPNPANERITIEGNNNTRIEIFNITGQLCKTLECDKLLNNIQFDIRDLDPGIYMISIIKEDKKIIKKLIKI